MTVQFILPEATSFPKERKLHDRLFLVLLYNLLCKTFKDHSSASAASSLSERNPLLQERCFPIASAKVEHSCIPCKRSPKKNARNFHLRPFCHFIALQNRQQSPFFRRSPTPPFSLQNLRFSRFSPFRTRFRAIFREIALVFSRSTVYFLSHSPILNPISGDFSMARHSFQPRTSIFPCFSLYFPTLRALLRDISPFIFPTLPFLHSMNAFPIRASLILHALPHPYLPIYPLRPSFPLPLRPLPQFPSHSSPLFHLPPQLTHERAHPRALRAYAYARTYLHVRRFSFIAFTASPTLRNPLYTNALWVKENEKKPSPNTQPPHNQYINTKHPISSAVNFISSPR